MKLNSVKTSDLDKETRDRLGISLMPSVEQAGARYIALGKVLKSLNNLEEEDVFWILQQAKSLYAHQGEMKHEGNGNGDSYVPPISWIMQVVARHYSITIASLKERRRTREIVLARQVVMYLSWDCEKYTLCEIGQALGGRSPATVGHGFQHIAKLLSTDTRLKKGIENIKGELA